MEQVHAIILDIGEIIKTYSNLLEKTGFSGANPEIYEFIQSTAKDLSKLKIVPSKDFTSIFDTYYNIKLTMYNLDLIGKIFELNRITESKIGTTSSSITISSKFVADLSSLLDTFISQMDLMKIKFQLLLLEQLFADKIEIPGLEEVPKFTDEINKIYKKYVESGDGIHVIDLYFEVLQRTYRAVTDKPGSKPIIQHINDTIYDIKQDLLVTETYQIIDKNLNHKNQLANAIQIMVQTFKLVPNEPATLDDQLEPLGVKLGKDLIKSLTTSSKLLGVGFILINKISPNSIQHDVNRVINPKKIMPSIAGVCPAVIERADTIQILVPEKLDLDPITVIGNFDTNYIFSTLDGKLWSRLAPWKDLAPVTIKLEPSTKVSMYNSIINEKILQNIHKPFVENQIDMQQEIKKRRCLLELGATKSKAIYFG